METGSRAGNDFDKYLGLVRRRWWVVVLTTLSLGPGAVLYSLTLPDRFKSSTMILVTPQKVPENFVVSTVTTDIQDRITTIQQQVLSRTSLEKVIDELQLFGEDRKKLSREELIERMRKNVTISVSRDGRRQADAFEIAYVASDPRVAMLAVSRLADLFIGENLKIREQQAAGTSQFLHDEIERYREEVRQKEAEIYAFRRRYMNESPEQAASNQARLTELQNRLLLNTQSVNAAKDRKVALQQQLADIERRVAEDRERLSLQARASREREAAARRTGGDGHSAIASQAPSPLEVEISRTRAELARLRLTHTEKHPDVARLVASLRDLESRAVAESQARGAGLGGVAALADQGGTHAGANGVEPPVHVPFPHAYDQIRSEIARAESEINSLAQQNTDIQRAVEAYQGRIASAPARELQLKQLSEGYENVKTVLNGLIDRKLQADLSENMERKQKGEQFQILDPPNIPDRPVSPNRLGIVARGFGVGTALGIGIALLLDFLRKGVKSREELGELLGVPVLGVIPTIVTPEDRLKRRKLAVGISGASLACVLVAAVVVHFAVRPLPQAFGDLYSRIQKTHWTAMK